ncbi:hypothetical protein [Psychrobium sp. 1_MG-2023]|uniref:hypothetical protein n=1 Tax=Psychrobium sp. 1_MG-2023 TaxID=3062624 RepID=UPI000C3444C3|nr:hypothetical protein [Psychrobium sp. 1_MG-2023]MDP2561671.1 hypothetical protein [Psychrobium sp. 1_MG-2023]PKF57075.1 hypothetical protein CW748_08280 [Alteromonadales bacterium alter-6D02]
MRQTLFLTVMIIVALAVLSGCKSAFYRAEAKEQPPNQVLNTPKHKQKTCQLSPPVADPEKIRLMLVKAGQIDKSWSLERQKKAVAAFIKNKQQGAKPKCR